MMKRGKGVSYHGFDHRHQMLLQDYKQLAAEINAKKMKLQKTIQKKHRLAAEVKFLREKYASLTRNSSQVAKKLPKKNSVSSALLVEPQNSIKKPVKLSRFGPPSNSINTFFSKSARPQNSMHGIEVSPHEKYQRSNETKTTSMSALFDLNQVSTANDEEMFGIQTAKEHLHADKSNADLSLSTYKDIGGSSNVGSRDNSWQALKV